MPQLDIFTLSFQFKSFLFFFFVFYFFFLFFVMPYIFSILWVRRSILRETWFFYLFFRERSFSSFLKQCYFFKFLFSKFDSSFNVYFNKFNKIQFESVLLVDSFFYVF